MIGDIIEFKGSGLVYGILSRLIKIFDRSWDRWGWHVAFVCYGTERNPTICEAVAGGVRLTSLNDLTREYRIHHWFGDDPPDPGEVGAFVVKVLNSKYDVAIYLWTGLQYVIRHLWNRRIPRLLDDRYTCWELVFHFCREMGKPIQSIHDCPMITDLVRQVDDEPKLIAAQRLQGVSDEELAEDLNRHKPAEKEAGKMDDMSDWPDGLYPRNEECLHCHSTDTSVAIHGAIRQWWCQSCGKPFMPWDAFHA